jgi:glycosyltransferase involved in cell wall biosynthesis
VPEYSRQLKSLVKNKNIKFKGTFDKNKVADIYKKIDVLVVPSVWFENAPLVIRNAILSKIPMITSDLPGMNFLVKDNVNGFNFKPGDSNDLKRKMLKFVSNPLLIEKFSKKMPQIKTIKENAIEHEKYYLKAMKI